MSDNARFGFVNFAETWNGRLAMMGFVIGLGTELLTGQGILSQIGMGRFHKELSCSPLKPLEGAFLMLWQISPWFTVV